MKGLFKYIKVDKILRWSFTAALIIFAACGGYIALFYFSLPPLIPLFNQMQWGEDRLGSRLEIFLPIVISACFLLLNLFLAQKLYEKMPLVSRIISITTMLVNLLSFIFIVRTIQIIL